MTHNGDSYESVMLLMDETVSNSESPDTGSCVHLFVKKEPRIEMPKKIDTYVEGEMP